MLQYLDHECYGPLVYYHLIHQMTNIDAKAIRSITRELSDKKLSDHEGQSVTHMVKLMRATLRWLKMVEITPPDIDTIVLEIFETYTVTDFSQFLSTLQTNAVLNGHTLHVDEILMQAEEKYRLLILSKKWDAIGPTGSSFYQRGELQCDEHNSGGRGRSGGHGSSGRDRTSGRGGGPRVIFPNWACSPPAEGEPHTREEIGQVWKYCNVCRHWKYGDRGHLTADHVFRPSQDVESPQQANTAGQQQADTAGHYVAGEPIIDENYFHLSNGHGLTRTYFTGGL